MVDVHPYEPPLPFDAYRVRGTKTDQRAFIAGVAMDWVHYCKAKGHKGAIMLDIDDTLIDGNERVAHGFDAMREFFHRARRRYPVYLVTARPDSDHAHVLDMLQERGFGVDSDRLFMLPAKLYGLSYDHVVEFKWNKYKEIRRAHGGVIVRIGDKMWDVARAHSLRTSLKDVKDTDCLYFLDPAMPRTLSCKLPGAK